VEWKFSNHQHNHNAEPTFRTHGESSDERDRQWFYCKLEQREWSIRLPIGHFH